MSMTVPLTLAEAICDAMSTAINVLSARELCIGMAYPASFCDVCALRGKNGGLPGPHLRMRKVRERDLAGADAQAKLVGVPDCAANALPQNHTRLVRVSEPLAEHGRGDLRALANDVAGEIAEQHRGVGRRAIARHEIAVTDGI